MSLSAPNGLGLSLADGAPISFSSSAPCHDQKRDEVGEPPRRLRLSQLYAHARSRRQLALSSPVLGQLSDTSLPALVADSGSGTSGTDSGSGSDSDSTAPSVQPDCAPLARRVSSATLWEEKHKELQSDTTSSDEEAVPTWRQSRPMQNPPLTTRVPSGGRGRLGLRGLCMSQQGDRYTTPVSSFAQCRADIAPCPPSKQQPFPTAGEIGRGLPHRPTFSRAQASSRSSSEESGTSAGTTVMRSTSSPSPPGSPMTVVAIELTVTPPTPEMKTNLRLPGELRESQSARVPSVSLRGAVAPPPQEACRYPTSASRYYAHTLSLNPPPFDVAPGRNIKLHDRIQHERDYLQLLLNAEQVIQRRLKEQQLVKQPMIEEVSPTGPLLRSLSDSGVTKTALPSEEKAFTSHTSADTSTREPRSVSTLIPSKPRLPSCGASNSLPRRIPSQRLMRPVALSSDSPPSSDEDDFGVRPFGGVSERVQSALPTNRLAALRNYHRATDPLMSSASSESASSDEDSDTVRKRRLARAHMLQRTGQRTSRATIQPC